MTADSPAELSIPSELGRVRQASDWLERAGAERRLPAEQILRLDLCLNEVLANIICHGGLDGRSPPIRISLAAARGGDAEEAILTVTDAGIPFDPLAYQQKPRPQTLAEAEPGGLGIMMMRDAADAMCYRYCAGCNQLTITVRWTDAT